MNCSLLNIFKHGPDDNLADIIRDNGSCRKVDKLQLWAVPVVELRKVNELYTISCKSSSSLNKEELPGVHLFVLAREPLVHEQTFSLSSLYCLYSLTQQEISGPKFPRKPGKKLPQCVTFEPNISAVLPFSNTLSQALCTPGHQDKGRASQVLKAIANITFCFQVGESVTVYNHFQVNVSSFS